MSNVQVHKRFSQFGLYMTIIGILIIVDLILVIPTMFLGGIGMILRLLFAVVPLVLMILGLIQLFLSNKIVQSKELNLFFYLKIVAITANTAISITTDILYGSLLQSFIDAAQGGGGISELWQLISGSFLLTVLGWAVLIVDIVAWGKLVAFFDDEPSFLSEVDNYKAKDSANKLKIASILNVLSFLVITAIVGFIFTLIGYFNLGKTLRSSSPRKSLKEPTLDELPSKPPKFCSKCGTSLEVEQKECPNCGAIQSTS